MINQLYINGRFLSQKTTGVQRFAFELSRQLCLQFPQVIVLSPVKIVNPKQAAELKIQKIGKHSGHFWEQIELPLFLRKNQGILINFANTAPLFHKDNVLMLHDLSFEVNPAWFAWHFRTFYKFLIPRLARRARKLVTGNDFSKNEISRIYGINADRIDTVPSAASSEFKRTKKKNKGGRGYILAVGSIDPRKNLKTLVKAHSMLEDKGIDLELKIIGQENKNFAAEHRANSERISYLGYVSNTELVKYYQNAFALVYPSLYEGFGIPPIEAMASGCPVLASDIGCLRETCGRAALYFSPDSPGEIVSQIAALLKSKKIRDQLLAQGFKQAARFSWKKSADKMAAIIRAL